MARARAGAMALRAPVYRGDALEEDEQQQQQQQQQQQPGTHEGMDDGALFGPPPVFDWTQTIRRIRPWLLLFGACIVYAIYWYIAERVTLNVADSNARDAINSYRRSQPAVQAHHDDFFLADLNAISAEVRFSGERPRWSAVTYLSVADAKLDGGIADIWRIFGLSTTCSSTAARARELEADLFVEVPAYRHGCVADGSCVLEVTAATYLGGAVGVPMYELLPAASGEAGRVQLRRLTAVTVRVSYAARLRGEDRAWRLDGAEGTYATVLADVAYEDAAAGRSLRGVAVRVRDSAAPERLTYPQLTGAWRLAGVLSTLSVAALIVVTVPPFVGISYVTVMSDDAPPPCWRMRLSWRGW